jgi:hypothetical protein
VTPCECPLGGTYMLGCPHHGAISAGGFDASWSESAWFVARVLLHLVFGGRLRVWYAIRGRREYPVLFEMLP